MTRLKITYLEIEGFRAFRSKVQLDFSKGVNVLLGPVGSGKTSVIKAIEFALFGQVYEVRKRIFQLSDLVNAQSPQARVKLVLSSDEENIIIERTLKAGQRSKLRVAIPGGELRDSRAEEFIVDLIGIELEDYSRIISPDFLAIQSMIYGSPAARSAAIDRLLGIEFVEGIFRSIPVKMVEDRIKIIQHDIKDIEEELESYSDISQDEKELEEATAQLEDLKNELAALEENIKILQKRKGELEENARKYEELKRKAIEIKGIIDHLKGEEGGGIRTTYADTLAELEAVRDVLASKLEEVYESKEADELRSLELSEDKIRNVLEKIEEKLFILERARDKIQEELQAIHGQIEAKQQAVKMLERELGRQLALYDNVCELEHKLNILIEKYGERENIEAKIRRLEIEREKIRELYKQAICVSELRKNMLTSASKDASGQLKCPVCESPVDAARIKELLVKCQGSSASISEKLKDIDSEIQELKKVLSEIDEIERELARNSDVKSRVESLKAKLEEEYREINEMREIWDELKSKSLDLTVTIRSVKRKLRELERAVHELTRAQKIRKYEKIMEKLESKLAQLYISYKEYETVAHKLQELVARRDRIIGEIKVLEERIQLIRDRITMLSSIRSEYEHLLEKMKQLKRVRKLLIDIRNAFREIQADLREEILSTINAEMNKAFRSVYPYSDYTGLSISVSRKSSREYKRSIYDLTAVTSSGERVSVLARMSEGQKAIVAFSFIYALYRLVPHNIGFIILDDPLPNVDVDIRRKVVEMLASDGALQVILATQSRRLASQLEKAKIHEFHKE